MKYVVLGITSFLYAAAGASLAFGLLLLGRAVIHLTAYTPVQAQEVYLPGDFEGYGFSTGRCWNQARYQVGDRVYLAPGDCEDSWTGVGIRLRYKTTNPAESVVDNVSQSIARSIHWIAFGGVLGWCASHLRARSISLTGRGPSVRKWVSGAWGFTALLGYSAALARDLADVGDGFCDSRRGMLTYALERSLSEHERRLPRDWLRYIKTEIDPKATLTGPRECVRAMHTEVLAKSCAGGFHIRGQVDVGSPVCDLTGARIYKIDVEIDTSDESQTVNLRYLPSE